MTSNVRDGHTKAKPDKTTRHQTNPHQCPCPIRGQPKEQTSFLGEEQCSPASGSVISLSTNSPTVAGTLIDKHKVAVSSAATVREPVQTRCVHPRFVQAFHQGLTKLRSQAGASGAQHIFRALAVRDRKG